MMTWPRARMGWHQMNERLFPQDGRACPTQRRTPAVRLLPYTFVFGLLCVLSLMLSACGKDEEATPTPAPAPTAAEVVTAAPPTDSPLPSPTVANAQPVEPAPPTAVVTVTVAANGSTAVFVPLEVEPGIDCEIESHIDLAGYPNLEETLGCPTEAALLDPIAINEFGEGPQFDRFMLWFSHEGLIYVLFPDGRWQSFKDTWDESEPTYPCNPLGGEPDSPPLPRRGFGKLWCSDPELQEVMGAVYKEERLCQHSVLQRVGSGRLLACFEDATIRYFRILDNHTWDVVVQ